MEHPAWTEHFTTNLSNRGRRKIEAIILHHSAGHLAGDLATLCKVRPVGGVSADFEIARDGRIFKLNPQLRLFYSWHAGKAELDGHRDVNARTIGIEQEHIPGQDWPDAQVRACARLCRWLYEQKIVTTCHIWSHAHVARPPGRKTDPENYPWEAFSDFYHA